MEKPEDSPPIAPQGPDTPEASAPPEEREHAARNLSAARLLRLLEITSLVRRNPRLRMSEVLARLKVSRSQFYRDREELGRLGLTFRRRGRSGFALSEDPMLPPMPLSVGELLSLVRAVAALARAGDVPLACQGLKALLAGVSRFPAGLADTLTPFVERVVVAEGFGCTLGVLEVLEQAIAQKRRIAIVRVSEPSVDSDETDAHEGRPHLKRRMAAVRASEPTPITIDPEEIYAEGGRLHLKGLWVEENRELVLPLAEIKSAGATPFLALERTGASGPQSGLPGKLSPGAEAFKTEVKGKDEEVL